jgi:hypothetical protein
VAQIAGCLTRCQQNTAGTWLQVQEVLGAGQAPADLLRTPLVSSSAAGEQQRVNAGHTT